MARLDIRVVWHAFCTRSCAMETPVALVVERDPALRRLMRQAIEHAGYDVVECSNPLQLKVELRTSNVIEAQTVLLIVSRDIARECSEELAILLRTRAGAGRSTVDVALTSEFGARQQPPSFGPFTPVAILEKPFSLDELGRIARRCRARDEHGVAHEFEVRRADRG